MVTHTHIEDLNFNKEIRYPVNKREDNKQLKDIDDTMLNTEHEYKTQLNRLKNNFKEFGLSVKKFAELTRPMPIGWTKMSFQTIYNILDPEDNTKFNSLQLHEFCRIMHIPVMSILEEPNDNKTTEVVLEFNFNTGSCEAIPFNKPRQALYYLKTTWAGGDSSVKAILFRETDYRKDHNVSLFDLKSKNLFRKEHGRDFMLHKHSLLKCAIDGKYYIGKTLKWYEQDYTDKNKTFYECDWQWYTGNKLDKHGMWCEQYEFRKKSKFTEIYPILYYDITLRNDHIILDLFKE